MPHAQDLEWDLTHPEENKENEEVTVTGECFDKTIPVENGDSVLFTVEGKDDVYVGKYVEEFNCVIKPDGSKTDKSLIDNWYHIPFNIIQEKLNTEAFNQRYNELRAMNSEEYKKNQIEEYIESNIVHEMGTLDDDSQFLIGLFTRNVRNGKIDFENYKFMMDILFKRNYIECNENIDLRNLNTICYNMYSIMGKISKETYDRIYDILASCAVPGEVI